MKYICKRFSVMIISYDKMNQLRHVRFLKNKEGVLAHMAKHRRRLIPCFDAVKTAFSEELTPCGDIAHWTNPKGGYFISLYVMPGCAKRVAQLCKECGLTLTGAGSAYPYHKDPQDSHLRIAPTYPSLDEVETASDLRLRKAGSHRKAAGRKGRVSVLFCKKSPPCRGFSARRRFIIFWRFPVFYEDERQSMAACCHSAPDRRVCLHGILWCGSQVR